MCPKLNKYYGFQWISRLSTNRVLDVLGKLFGVILGGLWCPRGHFWWSRGYRNIVENSSKFRGFPGTPGSERIRQVEGESLVQGGSKQPSNRLQDCKIQATRLEAVNSQDQKDLQGCKLTNMQYWKDLQGCKLTNCKHIPHSLMAHKGPADMCIYTYVYMNICMYMYVF